VSSDILVTDEGLVTTVTLNRPESLNSMPPAMVNELMATLAEVDADPSTNVIVLAGAGKGFCSGADVRSFGSAPDHRVHRRGWRLIHAMLDVEKPVIAKVHGPAAGLGLVVALFCDCVIVSDEAKLGDPHVSLGLVAGDGAVAILPLLIGPQMTKELLLTSRYISGREAADMGMVNRSVPAAELDAAVDKLAAEFAAQPTYAARATKAIVNRFVRSAVHDVLDTALAYEEISRGLPEYPEAVARWRAARANGH
jgi:enoyl-CoA hydratase/carnithine racemase